MKKILIIFIIGITILGLLTRCEDSIQIDPKDILDPDLSLTKIATYEQLINSVYDRMQSFNYLAQHMMLAPDALADNAILVNNTGRYTGELVNQPYEHLSLWFLYPAINDCNIIIDKIDTLGAADRARARVVAAQAYFLRGMLYFDMVRVHGYEPPHVVGDWNKGVILRDKPVFNVAQADLRSRATLEETYQLIEHDLLAAIDSMSVPGTTIPNQPFRANRAAAHALLAKVYLYWGKDALAITQVEAAIATKPAAVRLADESEYVAMFNTTPTTGRIESLFELRLDPGNGSSRDWSSVDGSNESLHSLTTFGITPSSQFVLAGSPELMASFEEGDVRRNLWETVNVRGKEYNMSLKWPGSAGAGLWADNIPVIRMSELYLIRAEAYYKLDMEPESRMALNTLRANRGLDDVDASVSGDLLFETILNEWRVEFAFEGHRWFDLKRNGLNIPKVQSDPLLYTDFRILAPLPLSQITLNPALEQNPGY